MEDGVRKNKDKINTRWFKKPEAPSVRLAVLAGMLCPSLNLDMVQML